MAFVDKQWRNVVTGDLVYGPEVPEEFNWEEVSFDALNGKYSVVLEAVLPPETEEGPDGEGDETLGEEDSLLKSYIVDTTRRTAQDGMVAVIEEIEANHMKFHDNGTLILFDHKSTIVALFAAGSWSLCMEVPSEKPSTEDEECTTG
jgi:hypothetical protein